MHPCTFQDKSSPTRKIALTWKTVSECRPFSTIQASANGLCKDDCDGKVLLLIDPLFSGHSMSSFLINVLILFSWSKYQTMIGGYKSFTISNVIPALMIDHVALDKSYKCIYYLEWGARSFVLECMTYEMPFPSSAMRRKDWIDGEKLHRTSY